jgi:hypothetical protein
VGVTPVVRYRDRMLLDGEEQYGIIEPLLTMQDRINETTFGMMVNAVLRGVQAAVCDRLDPEVGVEEMRAARLRRGISRMKQDVTSASSTRRT